MGNPAADLYFDEYEASASDINTDLTSKFVKADPEPAAKEKIRVIAIGGGGSNALNHIISSGVENVDFLALNTDVRSLEMSKSPNKIVLGERETKGLGAGARPEIGELAAKESVSDIRDYLRGADMVYLTAGFGGGTGTGALPIVASIAKEMNILTVAVVTKPFAFEGRRRMRFALEGIEKLRPNVDALIVIPNDRLLQICDKNVEITDCFAMADEVLREAVAGVTDLITKPGLVNVDFADLRSVMKKTGLAVMGVGRAEGDNRVEDAVKAAMESPLMECPMNGANGVLMNITCGSDLGLFEVQKAASYVEDIIADDATFVWGCVEDESMCGEIEIVIIATGFDEDAKPRSFTPKQAEPSFADHTQAQQQAEPSFAEHIQPSWQTTPIPAQETKQPTFAEESQPQQVGAPAWLRGAINTDAVAGSASGQTSTVDSDVFDTPTFIRRKNTVRRPLPEEE